MAYGEGSLFQRQGRWYISYYINGKRLRYSTKTRDRTKAERILFRRAREMRALADQAKLLRDAFWKITAQCRITGAQVAAPRYPLVYVWARGNQILYVGKADAGIARPLSPGHHRLTDMLPTDELHLHWCSTAVEAVELERRLILKYAPPLNRETRWMEGRRGSTSPTGAGLLHVPRETSP